MIPEWLVSLEITGRSWKTVAAYERHVRAFDRFLFAAGRRCPELIQLSDLEAWRLALAQREIGAATIAVMIGPIRLFFGWLHTNGHMLVNPALVSRVTANHASIPTCPSEDEIQRLLGSVSGSDPVACRDRAILEIAYSTGARMEEISQLNLDALNDTGIRLVGRTGRERMAPLTRTAVAALGAYLHHGRPRLLSNAGDGEAHAVFFSNREGRFSRRAIEIMIKLRSRRCGLTLTGHAIRSAFSTHLRRGSAVLADVSQCVITRDATTFIPTGGLGRPTRTSMAERSVTKRTRDAKSLPEPLARFRPQADSWFDHMRARNLSPLTIIQAGVALSSFGRFLESRNVARGCCAVSKSDLEAWFASRVQAGHAPSFVEGMIGPVIRFFTWLEKRGEIFQNPAAGLQLPRFHRRMQPVPSEAEVNRLLDSIPLRSSLGIRDRAILETAYASGLRRAELAGMNVDSVDLHHGTVRVIGKGSRERVVPLTKTAVKILTLYLGGPREKFLRGRGACSALWLSFNEGERMTRAGLHEMVCLRARDVGLNLSMQSLRRAFATHLLHHGASPMDLKLFLGHATFKHLKHYLRYAPQELQAIHGKSRPGR